MTVKTNEDKIVFLDEDEGHKSLIQSVKFVEKAKKRNKSDDYKDYRYIYSYRCYLCATDSYVIHEAQMQQDHGGVLPDGAYEIVKMTKKKVIMRKVSTCHDECFENNNMYNMGGFPPSLFDTFWNEVKGVANTDKITVDENLTKTKDNTTATLTYVLNSLGKLWNPSFISNVTAHVESPSTMQVFAKNPWENDAVGVLIEDDIAAAGATWRAILMPIYAEPASLAKIDNWSKELYNSKFVPLMFDDEENNGKKRTED